MMERIKIFVADTGTTVVDHNSTLLALSNAMQRRSLGIVGTPTTSYEWVISVEKLNELLPRGRLHDTLLLKINSPFR